METRYILISDRIEELMTDLMNDAPIARVIGESVKRFSFRNKKEAESWARGVEALGGPSKETFDYIDSTAYDKLCGITLAKEKREKIEYVIEMLYEAEKLLETNPRIEKAIKILQDMEVT